MKYIDCVVKVRNPETFNYYFKYEDAVRFFPVECLGIAKDKVFKKQGITIKKREGTPINIFAGDELISCDMRCDYYTGQPRDVSPRKRIPVFKALEAKYGVLPVGTVLRMTVIDKEALEYRIEPLSVATKNEGNSNEVGSANQSSQMTNSSNKDENQNLFVEGDSIEYLLTRYERNPVARKKCIEFWGCKCQVCGFDFEEKYGQLGAGFIEVHHRESLGERGEGHSVDPRTDLIPLCSNCHRMIHHGKKTLSTDDLKQLVAESKSL